MFAGKEIAQGFDWVAATVTGIETFRFVFAHHLAQHPDAYETFGAIGAGAAVGYGASRVVLAAGRYLRSSPRL